MITSQVKTKQSQSYKLKKKMPKIQILKKTNNFTRDTPGEVAAWS